MGVSMSSLAVPPKISGTKAGSMNFETSFCLYAKHIRLLVSFGIKLWISFHASQKMVGGFHRIAVPWEG